MYGGPHNDLHAAIMQHAFVHSKNGATIVRSEITGKRALWIFDFRALVLQPRWLNRYAEIFWERYADKYPFQVGGMESGAISLVAAIVMKGEERRTPVNGFYIRKSRKRYDLMKRIEGTPNSLPVILVDDISNSGRTFAQEADIIAAIGGRVSDAFAIMRYRDRDAYEFAEKRGIALDAIFSLADFDLELPSSDSPETPRDSFVVKWHFEGPDPSFHLVIQKSAPVIDENLLFFGADSGAFYALDQNDGSVVWEKNVGKLINGKSILSTPAIHDGVVYFGAYDGNTYALDSKTGRELWRNHEADYIGSSPSLASDLNLLYIGLEFGLWTRRGGIAAINLTSGKTVWRQSHREFTHATPLYIKEEALVVIGGNDHIVHAYEAKSGEPRWNYATEGDIKVSPAYDASRRIVLISSMDGALYALSAKNGEPMWAKKTGEPIYSIPLVHGDSAYVASMDKYIYALDIETGKERWKFETAGRIFGAPVIALGSLWCGSNDGRLYELDPVTGKLKHFFQATERVMSKIACNEKTGRIFFRTVANEVYCLKRKSA